MMENRDLILEDLRDFVADPPDCSDDDLIAELLLRLQFSHDVKEVAKRLWKLEEESSR